NHYLALSPFGQTSCSFFIKSAGGWIRTKPSMATSPLTNFFAQPLFLFSPATQKYAFGNCLE
ncbi:MAG: hypothetical protein FWE56_03000, partial [Candidatus Bathyarchaeota archaeon]|nr:hypothetical protein [Candidatus Termiticorpusculum sp.]MCL2868483.1 hypothetical protein [Candidatus Termiticorpusculum sp.]